MVKSGEIYSAVETYYRDRALEVPVAGADCCSDDDCCGGPVYSVQEVAELPDELVAASLACGNPLGLAQLCPGETVLDLGSGAGLDAFLAARAVGEAGQVIGVDMTKEMIGRANANRAKLGLTNVSFRPGRIESLPVASESVDVIISNCVINLSPDKPAVFREAFRVLRPGGRLAVADMVTQGHFSQVERADLAAWSACISGAEDVGAYTAALSAAGFVAISIRDKDAPEIELAQSISLGGKPRLFSALIKAVKPA